MGAAYIMKCQPSQLGINFISSSINNTVAISTHTTSSSKINTIYSNELIVIFHVHIWYTIAKSAVGITANFPISPFSKVLYDDVGDVDGDDDEDVYYYESL